MRKERNTNTRPSTGAREAENSIRPSSCLTRNLLMSQNANEIKNTIVSINSKLKSTIHSFADSYLSFQDGQECILRDFDVTHLFHTLLTRFLLLK